MNVLNKVQLIKTISEEGYYGLFLLGKVPKADFIWLQPNIIQKLESIYLNNENLLETRFLAAEIILSKSENYSIDKNAPTLAYLYATALTNTGARTGTFRLSANMWGHLYARDDAGVLGHRFIQIGEDAIPLLIDILDNEEDVLYEGSREATTGSSYQYRLKDFAIFYLSKIKKISIQFYKDFDKRDQEIERLKNLLQQK